MLRVSRKQLNTGLAIGALLVTAFFGINRANAEAHNLYRQVDRSEEWTNFLFGNSGGGGTTNRTINFTPTESGKVNLVTVYVNSFTTNTSKSFNGAIYGNDIPNDGSCQLDETIGFTGDFEDTQLGFSINPSFDDCELVAGLEYSLTLQLASSGGANTEFTLSLGSADVDDNIYLLVQGANDGSPTPNGTGEIQIDFPTNGTSTPPFNAFRFSYDVDSTEGNSKYALFSIVYGSASSSVNLWNVETSSIVGTTTVQQTSRAYVTAAYPGSPGAGFLGITPLPTSSEPFYARAFLYLSPTSFLSHSATNSELAAKSGLISFEVVDGALIMNDPAPPGSEFIGNSSNVDCSGYTGSFFTAISGDAVTCYAKKIAYGVGAFFLTPTESIENYMQDSVDGVKNVFPLDVFFAIQGSVASSTQDHVVDTSKKIEVTVFDTPVTILSSSTLATGLGSDVAKNSIFDVIVLIGWLFVGYIIYRTVY